MAKYQTRKIRYKQLVEVEGWKIKVYTLMKQGSFEHEAFYQNVLSELPSWLKIKNGFNDSNDQIAFLILHVGTEGIFSLVNWWVGKNMLNTHIFLTDHDNTNSFKKISGNGLAPCTWELEIINHERVSWTNHVLKPESPDFDAYLRDVINKEL